MGLNSKKLIIALEKGTEIYSSNLGTNSLYCCWLNINFFSNRLNDLITILFTPI